MTLVILPVTHIEQIEEGECLVACAAMVLNYMGIPASHEQLIELLRIKTVGTAFFHIRELERLGLTVVYKKGTLDEIRAHLVEDRPCIAPLKTAELPYWDEATDHAVVVG